MDLLTPAIFIQDLNTRTFMFSSGNCNFYFGACVALIIFFGFKIDFYGGFEKRVGQNSLGIALLLE